MSVVAHLTAEICPFANLVAQKNFYDDDKRAGFSALHLQDVNDISQELIDAWVGCIYSSSLRPLTKVAIMVAGFPCKGTSRCRDTGRAFESRPGLADPQSTLF
jgi:site-specific DNA-cytosine methylase